MLVISLAQITALEDKVLGRDNLLFLKINIKQNINSNYINIKGTQCGARFKNTQIV